MARTTPEGYSGTETVWAVPLRNPQFLPIAKFYQNFDPKIPKYISAPHNQPWKILKSESVARSHKVSVWRLIGGVLILAGVSYSLRQLPSAYGLSCVIAYLLSAFVFVAIGVWLLISYLKK